jgi:2-polyprenyl-3-methyl-5-hydroxy-6-metoxy-1,4-benzoquinol methylase
MRSRAKASFSTVREARRLCDREIPMTRSVWSVADIGCGAGTQSIMWAQKGHEVHGLDINAQLVELAAKRAGAPTTRCVRSNMSSTCRCTAGIQAD